MDLRRRLLPLLLAAVCMTQCGRIDSASPFYPAPDSQPATSAYPITSPTATIVPPSPVPMPAERAPDFAFRFAYGACGTDLLDTFAGTYSKDMLVAAPITLTLTLSPEQQTRIYAKMRDINMFAYPPHYVIDTKPTGPVGTVIPFEAYAFMIRNAGRTHTVTWDDNIVGVTSQKADQLRELAQLIIAIIYQQQSVQQLPKLQAGCL